MRWYVKEFGPASKVAVSGAQAARACLTPEEVVVELSGTAQQSNNRRISDGASVMIGLIKSYGSFEDSSCGLLIIVSMLCSSIDHDSLPCPIQQSILLSDIRTSDVIDNQKLTRTRTLSPHL